MFDRYHHLAQAAHFSLEVSSLNQIRKKGETTRNGQQKNCSANTGKATKGKVQDIGEVNKVMPLPLPSSVG